MNNLEMSGLCRCCLSNDSVQLNNMFEPCENMDIGEAIQAICGIDIFSNSHCFPNQICDDCLDFLKTSYYFRIRTQQSDKTLQGILQGNIIAKEYNTDIDQFDIKSLKEPTSPDSDSQSNYDTSESNTHKLPITIDMDHSNDSQCPYCQKYFVHRKNLRTHMQRHFSEGKFPCNQCPDRFYTKFDLQRHMIKIHAVGVFYKCELCDKEFPTKPELNRHEKLHNEKKPYACMKCGMEFKLKHNAQQHINSHEKRMPFSCLICGKKFAFACKLRNHNKIKCQPSIHISVLKDEL